MDHTPATQRSGPLTLPNALTYGRIAAVPALVACLLYIDGPTGRWAAFILFALAALTDWLDGYLARAWSQHSRLGQMLDPIADKLLVGAALIMLVYDDTIRGHAIWAAVIILSREILVSGLREFLSDLNVRIRVSILAKWKTGVQMAAIALLLIGPASDQVPGVTDAGLVMLWLAAVLTIWTGFDYLKAAVGHALED